MRNARPRGRSAAAVVTMLLAALAFGACQHEAPAKDYQLKGQILAVDAAKQALTISHDDIPGLMPAMTMTYQVATPALMTGRTPGELITATLEVTPTEGRLVAIAHTGTAPLPTSTNEVALAEGILAVGDEIPDAALIDQDNVRRSLRDWKGTPMVVTFIYTRCPLPNYCPLMDKNFATIQREAAADPTLNGHVHLVSITFDPDHDTPAVLKSHAETLQANPAVWTFLTGDRRTTDRIAAKFGVNVTRDPTTPGVITHTLRTTVVGADGRVRKVYEGNDWTPAQVIADLRAALAAR